MFPSFPSCMLNVAMTFALSGINLGKEPVLFRGAVAGYLTFITQDYELGIRHITISSKRCEYFTSLNMLCLLGVEERVSVRCQHIRLSACGGG